MEVYINNKLEHIRNKGFLITNENKVKGYLENVGLHRLEKYLNITNNYNGFDFQNIINSYIFDKELRTLNLQLIEIFEKKLKNSLIIHIPDYLKKENYLNLGRNINIKREERKVKNRLIYNEKKIIDLKFNDNECKKSYNDNGNISAELFYDKLSFGEVLNIFKDLTRYNKSIISSDFNFNINLLEQWLTCILDLRNFCSHSSNIFNKKFIKKIKSRDIGDKIGDVELDSYFGYMLILSILNKKIIPEYNWSERVFYLMNKYGINLNLFQIQKETSHIEHENSEAWEVLVLELYQKL